MAPTHTHTVTWTMDYRPTCPVCLERLTRPPDADDWAAATVPMLDPDGDSLLAGATHGQVCPACAAGACHDCGAVVTPDTARLALSTAAIERYHSSPRVIVCDDCADARQECTICHAHTVHAGAAPVTVDGAPRLVCSGCQRRRLVTCSDCGALGGTLTGERAYTRLPATEADRVLCPDCMAAARKAGRIVTCRKCRRDVMTDDAIATKAGGRVCRRCYDDTPGVSWSHNGYDHRFTAPDDPAPGYTYGIEIEVDAADPAPYDWVEEGECDWPTLTDDDGDEYQDWERCRGCTERACIHSPDRAPARRRQHPDNTARDLRLSVPEDFAIVKPDGSLNNGMEIVTRPASLAYLLTTDHLATLCQTAEEAGYSGDMDTCGLHIHAARRNFGDTLTAQRRTICRLIYLFELFKGELEDAAGRPACSWARWYGRDGGYTPDEMVDEMRNSLNSWYNSLRRRHDRYMAINLCNDNTVEFRLFAGTTDPATIKRRVQLVDNLIAFCRANHTGNIARAKWATIADYHKRRSA